MLANLALVQKSAVAAWVDDSVLARVAARWLARGVQGGFQLLLAMGAVSAMAQGSGDDFPSRPVRQRVAAREGPPSALRGPLAVGKLQLKGQELAGLVAKGLLQRPCATFLHANSAFRFLCDEQFQHQFVSSNQPAQQGSA